MQHSFNEDEFDSFLPFAKNWVRPSNPEAPLPPKNNSYYVERVNQRRGPARECKNFEKKLTPGRRVHVRAILQKDRP